MIKKIIKKIPGGVTFVHVISRVVKKIKEGYQEWRFAVKGPLQLYRVQKLFENYEIKFFVDMGTLLGIYRDKKLIKRDMDIDMAVYLDKREEILSFQRYMISEGGVHSLSFESEKLGIFQDTFYWNRIRVDVCYYRNEGEIDACYLMYDDNKIVKLVSSAIGTTRLIPFGKKKISAPEHTEQYLAERYGENWRVPDRGYIYWKGPSAVPIEERGVCKEIGKNEI